MATGYTVRASAFDSDKAARLGGAWWVECPHTATGEALTEARGEGACGRGAGEGWAMTRAQLSLELEEGRAAGLLGLPITANPYRKPEAQVLPRWDELARNWESGWTLGKAANEPR